MNSKTARIDHYWVISYEGDTTGLMPGPLPEVLNALQQGAIALILDLSKLASINRSGVKCILESIEASKKYNANVGIVSPPPEVRRILKLNGLDSNTPIYTSQSDAVQHLDLINYQDDARVQNTDTLLICKRDLHIGRHLRESMIRHPMKPHYRIIMSRDLEDAYKTLRKEKVDCVIVDSSMPMVQFEKFIENIQADRKLPSIPILVVSSEKNMPSADLMVRHGAHDLIKFPFSSSEIYIRLQMLISHLKDHRPFFPPDNLDKPFGMRA